MVHQYCRNQVGTLSLLRLFLASFLGLCIIPVQAQQSWQEVADSSNHYLAKREYKKAYDTGLRAALVPKPRQKADSIWFAMAQLAQRLPDSIAASTALNAGQYYLDQKEYERTRTILKTAEEKGYFLKQPRFRLKSYLSLAKAELSNEAGEKAARLYWRLLNDSNSQAYPFYRAEARNGLSHYYLFHSHLDSATQVAREALSELQHVPLYDTSKVYPVVRMNLARCAYLSGDLTTSIREIDESYSVAKKIMPNDARFILIGYMYTRIMSDINDDKALEATQKARQLLQRQPDFTSNPLYLLLISNEIGMLNIIDRDKDALVLVDSTLQRHSLDDVVKLKECATFLAHANKMYMKFGHDEELSKIATKVQELLTMSTYSREDSSYFYSILGRYFHYKGDIVRALSSLKEEARLDSSGKGISYIDHSLKNRLAICQALAGQRSDAYDSFQMLVREFDENARGNLWRMSEAERDNYLRSAVIHGLFLQLLKRTVPNADEIGLAYNYKLLIQGIRLKTERMINRSAYKGDPQALKTIQQLSHVRAQLADRRQIVADLAKNNQLQQTADSLERVMGEYAMTHSDTVKTVQWQAIRDRLKPGEAAIELIQYDNYSMNGRLPDSTFIAALVLRSGWKLPKLVHLPFPDTSLSAKTVSENTQSYIDALTSEENQQETYETFWKPLSDSIGAVNRVYIALDGPYDNLNLSTIRNFKTSKYVLEEVEIVRLNLIQDILERPHVAASQIVELIGHPTYTLGTTQANKPIASRRNRRFKTRDGLTFEELPYTRIEIQQLEKLFRSLHLKPRVHSDRAASEAAFLALRSPKLVHVATHGYVQDSNRNGDRKLLSCGLVLAGAADTSRTNSTDGLLTGYEASLLNLHDTELVVLSACETGVGSNFENEGTFGVQRAFLLAGAQSVLMSLWKVNDQLTQQLMTDFYQYWMSGLTKPQALRKAQLNLRKTYPEPYHWGAFVLIGQ